MRLSEYPYVVVRVSCTKCSRQGRYRLARLAHQYGSEIELPWLLEYIAGGCKLREGSNPNIYNRCGAYFVDIRGPSPPDLPLKLELDKAWGCGPPRRTRD